MIWILIIFAVFIVVVVILAEWKKRTENLDKLKTIQDRLREKERQARRAQKQTKPASSDGPDQSTAKSRIKEKRKSYRSRKSTR